ncbi:hypothetical protein [Celeribacter neptunius]|uniref:Uncharacterized protein n=1 Tax=Celeribacter neptunius TaxID=588602 RepID=A0A1I3IMT1_9RHOB|nr:hypothetical protein [Celeribacter neptunius]SFI49256.1 hypothetical protein SAMN04487991_0074 [Celeribacter neptunius]
MFAVATVLAGLLAGLSGCADRPDLSGRTTPLDPDLPWPSLIDISEVATTAEAATDPADTESDTLSRAEQLAARANALQSRARRLSTRPVLTTDDRNRLLAAIDRHF